MAGSPSPFSASSQQPASSSLRGMSSAAGGGGGRASGGLARKGRGGGTPTRSKGSEGKAYELPPAVAEEEEVRNAVGYGGKVSPVGRRRNTVVMGALLLLLLRLAAACCCCLLLLVCGVSSFVRSMCITYGTAAKYRRLLQNPLFSTTTTTRNNK